MRRRMWKWTARVVLAILLLALLGVGAAAIALHTAWGRDQIRAQIEAKLRPYFPGGAKVGRLEGSVLGDFTLHDIELTDRQGRRAVTIARVELNIELGAWLDDEARVEKLIVDGLTVALHQRGSEPPNLATMFQPNPDPLTFDVILERLQVKNAAISIEKDGRTDHLDGFTVDATARVGMNGAVLAEAKVRGLWRERAAPLVLDTEVAIDPLGVITLPSTRLALGDVVIDAADVGYASATSARGRVHVVVPEGALAALAPELEPPRSAADLHLTLGPSTAARGLAFTVRGTVAGASVLGSLAAQPLEPRPTLGGVLMIRGLDAQAAMARSPRSIPSPLPSTDLDATAVVALVYDPEQPGLGGVRGTVSLSGGGRVDAVRFDRVAGGITLDGRGGRFVLEADAAGDTHVRAAGHLAVEGQAVVLAGGTLTARTRRLDQAAQGRMAIAGALTAELAITGRFESGAPRFEVRGTVDGRGLRRDDLRIGTLAVRFDVGDVPGRPGGTMSLRTTGVRSGATAIPDVVLSARGRYGGGYDVTVTADDRVRDLHGRLRATVTVGDLEQTYGELRITSYDVDARGLAVSGRGGRVAATRDRITVRGLQGDVAGGSFTLDASAPIARPDAATGELVVTGIALERLRGVPGMPQGLRGTIGLRAGLERGRGHLSVAVQEATIGSFTASVEAVPPRRVTDPEAWKRLDRRAIRALHVEAKGLDLAAAATALELEQPLQGLIDGALHLEGTNRSGELHARGLVAAGLPVPLDADVIFDLTDPAVTKVDLSATLRTIGKARVLAAVRVPVQLFDVRAWRRLGVGAVDSASLRVEALEIDELMAARFGLGTVRGVFTIDVSAAAGLRQLDATVVARELLAGPLVEPAALTLEVKADSGGTTARAVVALRGKTVLEGNAAASIDVLAALRRGADPARIPISGKMTLPSTELASWTAALGQAQRLPGTVHGSGTLEGTVAAPVIEGAVTIENLGARRPRDGGPLRGGIQELKLSGRYVDGAVDAQLRGKQADGGMLDVRTALRLDRPAAASTTVIAKGFQLRPLARLLPDVLFGVSGQLDADLRIAGLEPETVKLDGTIKLSGATAPLSDTIGVLRDGEIVATFAPGGVMKANLTGAVESGRVEAVATATLDGVMPRTGKVDVTVRNLELITTSAPRVDGKLHADIRYDGAQVKIDARIVDGEVRSRASKGRALHPSNLPSDLVFASTAPGSTPPKPAVAKVRDFVGAVPVEPFLLITLRVQPVSVTMPELRGDVTGKLDVAVGIDGASLEGQLEVQRGDVELLERRYRLRRARVTFDGGFDPLLDIQLERDLPALTLYAAITGRLSSPELKLSSDPPNYTEGQLLSFAISDTAAATGNETADAASNLLAAVASQTLLSYITPILPVRLDVVAYEPASASTSRAFVFGRWLTRKLLVLYRNRAEAGPNENVNEAEAEYWLNQRVLLEGVAGDRGVLGLDLLWTRRW